MLSPKTNLSKCKKTEIISSISSEHNGMKLENNSRWETGKFTTVWKWNTTEEPIGQRRNKQKKKIKKYLKTSENKNNIPKLRGYNKSSSKGKVYGDKCLLYLKEEREREKRKIPHIQMHTHKKLPLHLQDLEEEQSTYGDSKISRQKVDREFYQEFHKRHFLKLKQNKNTSVYIVECLKLI